MSKAAALVRVKAAVREAGFFYVVKLRSRYAEKEVGYMEYGFFNVLARVHGSWDEAVAEAEEEIRSLVRYEIKNGLRTKRA